MFPFQLAAHRATPVGVLEHLTSAATRERSAWTVQGNSEPRTLGQALARNPALPPELLAGLLECDNNGLWSSVMRRPGLSPDVAIALLAGTPATQPWVAALSCVDDPHDVLLRAALGACEHPDISGRALGTASTVAGLRAAVAVFATKSHGNQVHASLYAAALEHHFDLRPDPAPAQVPTGTGQDTDHVRRALDRGAAAAAALISTVSDPDLRVAQDLLTAFPTDADVARAVLNRTFLTPEVRAAAARQFVTHAPLDELTGWSAPYALKAIIQTGPVDVAETYLQRAHEQGWATLGLLEARLDLSPDALTLIATTATELARTPTPLHDREPARWAARLALHPNSTPHVRALARDLVPPASGTLSDNEHRWAVAITNAAARSPNVTCAQLGARLSAQTLTARSLTPHVEHATWAALDGLLPSLPQDIGPVLVPLLGTFSGSIAQALTTARAIHA